jgi:hypothetical protein
MRIFIAGEGSNELGGWAKAPSDRVPPFEPGVLTTLVDRVAGTPANVVGCAQWKNLTKFRAGERGKPAGKGDIRSLRAAQLQAKEAGANILVALRDTDGHADREAALIAAAATPPTALRTVVGTPHLKLEAWILACAGTRRAEEMGSQGLTNALTSLGIPQKGTAAMVDVVENCDLTTIPPCATRLHRFLDDLRAALTGPTP